MKKWIITLVVVIGVVIYFVWPKARLEKPIVMSVQFEEVTKTLAVSYIVDQDDETYVMEVGHGTKGFYSPRTNGNWDMETNFTKVLAVQNGYELREDVVELTDDQLAYFLSLEGRALPVQISFDNYSPIETILVLMMNNEAVNTTKNGNTLRYTYTSEKDVTIDSIGHYDSVATISFEQNNREVFFPLRLTQGSTVDIIIHEPYKLSSKDMMLLEIRTTEDQLVTRNILMTESIPKGYLKQIVKESNANSD
ncbi:Uncharacterised protein [Bacillus freudenreichii]|nr:Uncharacterised protein [Bacillus freudenreichii]